MSRGAWVASLAPPSRQGGATLVPLVRTWAMASRQLMMRLCRRVRRLRVRPRTGVHASRFLITESQ